MCIYNRDLLSLIKEYGDLRAREASGSHELDRIRAQENAKYVWGAIEAKAKGEKPPFHEGEMVIATKYAQACGRRINLRLGECYQVRRVVYDHGWLIEVAQWGSDARFYASDFKKAEALAGWS